jgi:uncharacterized protein
MSVLWMQTSTGKKFFPASPQVEDVCIEDIAHALSRICRFGGHSHAHYSVSQHSVLVSRYVEDNGGTRQEILHGLLHDASEAYLGDVVWPLKQAPQMNGYRELEVLVENCVAMKFGLTLTMPAVVKTGDLVVLATEKRDVMGHADEGSVERQAMAATSEWVIDKYTPLVEKIVPLEAAAAKELFMARYAEVSIGI